MILSAASRSTLFRGWSRPAGVLLALLCAGPLRADEIHLKSGFVLEGKVVRREKYRLYVETLNGLQCIPLIRVVKVVPAPWVVAEFEEGLAREKERADRESLLRFYRWATDPERADRLAKRLPRLYRLMVRVIPDHEESRRRLGHVKVEGEWVDPEEARRLLEETKKRARARSWEEYEKEKAIRDRRNREAAKWGGMHLAEQIEANREGDRRVEGMLYTGLGRRVLVLSSLRISVRGYLGREEAEALLDLGERALAAWGYQLFRQVSLNPFQGHEGKFVFYAVRRKDLSRTVEFVSGVHGGMTAGDRRFYASWRLGIPANGWDHLSVRLLDEGGFDLEEPFLRDLARSWCEGASGARLAPWFPEGFALEAARRFLGRAGPVALRFHLDGRGLRACSGVEWPQLSRTLGRLQEDPPLTELMRREREGLTLFDLGKSAGLVSMLWDRDPRLLGLLLSALGYKHGTQALALMRVYGKKPETLDRMFREWAVSRR